MTSAICMTSSVHVQWLSTLTYLRVSISASMSKKSEYDTVYIWVWLVGMWRCRNIGWF